VVPWSSSIGLMNKGTIGRNDPCWCGSGKKYKKCHLTRSTESPIPFHQHAAGFHDLLRGDKRCMYPPNPDPCKDPVIRAHSISRNAALTKVARAGRVYQPNPNLFEIRKHRGSIRHTLVGINRATTFTGFCNSHDTMLFRPIDDGPITPTDEQSLLLHFRALCRELYVKRSTIRTNRLRGELDRGKPPEMQDMLQELVNKTGFAIQDSVDKMESDKAICDRALLTDDFTAISGCVLFFKETPTLACSGLTQPIYDFSGRMLQRIEDFREPLFNLSFTLLPNPPGGIAVFAWLRDGDAVCKPFMSSLLSLPDERKSDALVQLIFDSFENHAAQPDWWESLSIVAKGELEERLLNWTDARPINKLALAPGASTFCDWGFERASWI
jgi:SEC-C motif